MRSVLRLEGWRVVELRGMLSEWFLETSSKINVEIVPQVVSVLGKLGRLSGMQTITLRLTMKLA